MPLLRRRRPLLRAAAVGGGAYALGKHKGAASAEEDAAAAQQDPAGAAPAPQPAPRSGLTAEDTERLADLGRLHDQGVLTDEEFAQQKARILSGS